MTEERTIGGAPLDPPEAALLAALRARGLHALAEIAMLAFNDDRGDAAQALAELTAWSKEGTCQQCAEALAPRAPDDQSARSPCACAVAAYAAGRKRGATETEQAPCEICRERPGAICGECLEESINEARAHGGGAR